MSLDLSVVPVSEGKCFLVVGCGSFLIRKLETRRQHCILYPLLISLMVVAVTAHASVCLLY